MKKATGRPRGAGAATDVEELKRLLSLSLSLSSPFLFLSFSLSSPFLFLSLSLSLSLAPSFPRSKNEWGGGQEVQEKRGTLKMEGEYSECITDLIVTGADDTQ